MTPDECPPPASPPQHPRVQAATPGALCPPVPGCPVSPPRLAVTRNSPQQTLGPAWLASCRADCSLVHLLVHLSVQPAFRAWLRVGTGAACVGALSRRLPVAPWLRGRGSRGGRALVPVGATRGSSTVSTRDPSPTALFSLLTCRMTKPVPPIPPRGPCGQVRRESDALRTGPGRPRPGGRWQPHPRPGRRAGPLPATHLCGVSRVPGTISVPL